MTIHVMMILSIANVLKCHSIHSHLHNSWGGVRLTRNIAMHVLCSNIARHVLCSSIAKPLNHLQGITAQLEAQDNSPVHCGTTALGSKCFLSTCVATKLS